MGDLTEYRFRRQWVLAVIVVFIFIPLDLLTTIYAASLYGLSFEVNPIMVWALHRGMGVTLAVNTLGVILALVGFRGIHHAIRQSSDPYDRWLSSGVDVWLSGLLVCGVFLIANNLSAILFQESLIAVIVTLG